MEIHVLIKHRSWTLIDTTITEILHETFFELFINKSSMNWISVSRFISVLVHGSRHNIFFVKKWKLMLLLFVSIYSMRWRREGGKKIDESRSASSTVVSVIPQGVILGPLLFILLINNVFDVLLHYKIQLYGGDSKLYGDTTTIELCQAFERDILAVNDRIQS